MVASYSFVTLLVTALFVAGCSSDEESSGSGGSGGGNTGGTGGSSTGGASGTGGSAGTDAGTDGGALTSNPFIMSTSVLGNGTATNLLFLNYVAEPGQRCAVRISGPCRVLDCMEVGAAEGPLPPGVPAGKLELLRDTTTLLSAEAAVDGAYPATSKDGQLWSPGDSLLLEASGAAVPAFSQQLAAPGPIELDPSMLPDSGAVTVKRSTDYVVKWKPLSSQVTISLNQFLSGQSDLRTSVRLVCEFQGTDGQGVIPKDALSALEPTTTSIEPSLLNFGASASKDVSAGEYSIHVYALYADRVDMIVED